MACFTLFFDESGKSHTHPVTSLTGVCAPTSRIGQFEGAWRALLRHYELKSFHMVDAIRSGKPWVNCLRRNGASGLKCSNYLLIASTRT